MVFLLSLVFFASGAAALLFETLWFRQAGLVLGNSVWASSLVTSSFMGGLAVGNAWAARRGEVSRRPLHLYAGLEIAIGVTGPALVFGLPSLTGLLAPFFGLIVDNPVALNIVRFGSAFLLLLIPASAMGATLPVLAGALARGNRSFARVLGVLYGSNTLGAVAGALAGELFLIERFGVRGTALVAAGINTGVAIVALALSRRLSFTAAGQAPQTAAVEIDKHRSSQRRILAAAFLSGAILLSFEVIWFRLLQLFAFGTSLAFALMLATVLLGIGSGGLIGGGLSRSDEDASRWLPVIACFAGIAGIASYAALSDALTGVDARPNLSSALRLADLAAVLILPLSVLSGFLFTLMGGAMRLTSPSPSHSAGALTLTNTTGAMFGSLLTTFVFLPRFGMERCVFGLSLSYGVVAVLTGAPARDPAARRLRLGLAATGTVFLLMSVLFPFGLMQRRYARYPITSYLAGGQLLAAYREGLTETISYLVRDLWGVPASYRLVTNSYSMSGSHFASARYMRFFVNLPVALRPEPKTGLLISYGVGITAKALSETRSFESIDVVDISRDILELGRIVFPERGTFPLDDPRVRVHIEDGRFFLLTTDRKFDLITSEPPPPKGSGVVNLYAREYFDLVRRRLSPGGIASYWLPVYQTSPTETKSIIAAFCASFDDCSLWTGAALEWMLVGTNGLRGPVDSGAFAKQWNDPVVSRSLASVGFETPALAAATFLADAAQLRAYVDGTATLEDNYPLRLSPRIDVAPDPSYFRFMDADAARQRFVSSRYIESLLPVDLREAAKDAYREQQFVNRADDTKFGASALSTEALEAMLTQSARRLPVLAALKTEEAEIRAARDAARRGVDDPFIDELLGIGALADRDYENAAANLLRAERGPNAEELRLLRVVVLGLAGKTEDAKVLIESTPSPKGPQHRATWTRLRARYRAPA